MTFEYSIDNKTRFVVIYQDVTKTPTRISKLLGIPLSTIHSWIKSLQNDEDIFSVEPGRGRKRAISSEVRNIVARTAKRTPQRSSSQSLGARYEMSHTKVQEIIKTKNKTKKS